MKTKEKGCCFTGHRFLPKNELAELENKLYTAVTGLIAEGFTRFYCGGALGFDTLAARAVLKARERFDIELILLLPFEEQCERWQNADKNEYLRILALADSFEYIGEKKDGNAAYFMRDRALVNTASVCVCYCNRKRGGTAYTVKFAKEQNLEIINLATQSAPYKPQMEIDV